MAKTSAQILKLAQSTLNPLSLNQKGMTALKDGDYELALLHFQAAAIPDSPARPTAIHNQAVALHYLGRMAEAAEAYMKAFTLGNRSSENHIRKVLEGVWTK